MSYANTIVGLPGLVTFPVPLKAPTSPPTINYYRTVDNSNTNAFWAFSNSPRGLLKYNQMKTGYVVVFVSDNTLVSAFQVAHHWSEASDGFANLVGWLPWSTNPSPQNQARFGMHILVLNRLLVPPALQGVNSYLRKTDGTQWVGVVRGAAVFKFADASWLVQAILNHNGLWA